MSRRLRRRRGQCRPSAGTEWTFGPVGRLRAIHSMSSKEVGEMKLITAMAKLEKLDDVARAVRDALRVRTGERGRAAT